MWRFLFFLCAVAFILQVNPKGNKAEDERRRYYASPPDSVEHLVLGYRDATADLFWIRVLQDLDICERQIKGEKVVNAGIGAEEALTYKLPPSHCDKGWVYHMLDSITTLAPRFKLAYRTGATALSIMVGDREGARLFYEKAMTQFPEDWVLAYRAAYHYIYEIQNPQRAADLLVRAKGLSPDAPWWLPYLAARLYSRLGQLELSRKVLLEFIDEYKDEPKMVENTKARLKAVEAEIAKTQTDSNKSKKSTAQK